MPRVRPLAEEHIAAQGLAGRIAVRSGDFLAEPLLLPGEPPFETLFLSNILHLFPEPANRALLGRAAAALAPDGRLLIHDVLMEEDGVHPVYGAMLSLTMCVMSDSGATYPEARVRAWLEEVGLEGVERIPVEEDIALLVARRARRGG
jgi:hypothetical protein